MCLWKAHTGPLVHFPTSYQLLTCNPPLALPPNNKRRSHGGWAMIDAGDFAVHILSNEAREKFFPDRREFW